MRARIANVLRDQNIIVKEVSATPEIGSGSFEQPAPFRTQVSVPAPAPIATPPTPSAPAPLMENYRIMFHMMTQDHKLPDFIWNEQTRSELRAMLDTEVRDFEQQQRLKGAHRIAWNYQQFSVRYDSLKEEVQIGFVYLRPFLEAGDTFIRSLINPSHLVLFEKLLRRVLVNADTNSKVSILCTKCLTRLYSVARDFIGEFDDMMLIIKILERSNNLEMQHCLIDLLEVLCEEPGNAVQFLDKEFVSVIMQYASLAHLNPDQIGNMLAQMTSKVLMLTDAVEGSNISGNLSSDSGLKSSGNTAAVDGAEEMVRTHRRSMWIPPDNLCPKVWFVAPKGSIPPPANKIRGPFRVSDLVSFFDEGQLDDGCLVAPSSLDGYDEERFDAVVDTGKWRAFNDYFQLRIQMLYPGKAMYTPAEISRKALHMLTLVSSLHKAVDSRKKPFYPVPQSKRIMSTTDHLVVLAQLLLSNDHEVVTLASQLLQSLVEYNPTVTSKLYLTGVFFFACRYAGNDFLPLAKLLDATHLRQSFHDASAAGREHSPASKSVLNSMLPFALINTLVNYGSERFSTVFTGVFDTPEVIWNAELRHQLVEMINLHLGDLLSRLRQFNMIRYDYCPIPTVYYQSLDKELYVYEYYLRNLCDEKRFPDYHILQPLQLFRECLERWREEMAKGVADVSVADSKSLLGLPGKYDNKDLRKAYKNLAKQYHPDKNAGGRDMFEKVQKAYELLSMVEAQAAETDLRNVLLLIKTQNIIYRRFPNEVSDQKYPGYTLLMDAMRIPPVSPPCTGIESEILSAGALLLYYTNSLSPLNAREFVKIGAVEKLQKIVEYALEAFHYPETKAMAIDILVNSMKAYTSVANFDLGRDTLMGMVPGFTNLLPKVLALSRTIPLATESCLEIISRCAIRTDLQDAIISSGVIWKMIPMLLGFDGTLQEDFSDESQRSVYNQAASNMHGVIAIKALGRLGGYMFDDLASPENVYVKTGLSQLLTAPLAKFLRNRRPWELLGALNENVESGTKIWNVGMRKELLHFVTNMDAERPPGSREDDLAPAMTFQYSCLKDELCIGGVYVRIFNRTGQTTDVEDPSQFARDLLNYVAGFKNIASPSRSDNEHQEFAIEGLHSLADAHKYIAGDVVAHPGGLDTVFSVLQRHQDSPSFASGVKLIHSLCESPEFISAAVKADPPAAWRLLQTICTTTSPHASSVWNSADFWAANPDGLGYLVDIGAVPHLMGVILGVAGYNSSYAFRLYAVQLLTKFLSNHLKGADASAMLRRFLPEPVVVLIKTRQGAACLQALDDVCENPELIWTAEMQGELRKDLTALLIRSDGKSRFQEGLDMPGDYTVTYRQLREEIYLGSVYVRLYLKQPTFRLSNAIFFAEKLVEFWESSFNTQVPLKAQGKTHNMVEDDGRALVLGKEDFLTLVTSCMAIVLKGEIAVIDYLLQWDFPKTLCDSLKRALDMERRGVPVTSIARLLNQLSTRIDVVDSLSVCRNDVILQLTRSLNLNSNMGGSQPKLPKEATLITEVLKKIYSSQGAHSIGHLVQCGIKAGLHNYLLDHVLSTSRENLADVTFPTALHVHAVDVLKSMAALDESNIIRVLLENHPAWGEYKDQRHDLFISDAERSDPYLIKDATTASYYALLTDGSGDNKAASHFTSTTSAFTTAMPIFSETASKQEVAITKPAELTPAPVAAKQVVVSSNPTPVASSSAPTSASPPRSTSGAKTQLKTMVIKGAHGLGLDVAKSTLGVACIVGFKAMPEGVEHPCAKCDPQLEKYDVIVAVNKNPCPVFSDAVQALKGCPAGPILLTVERKV